MKQVFIFLVLLFFSSNTLLNAQLKVGDPGVTFDQALIVANSSCYPQMQRWSEAGVIGGIPFLTDFDQTATIGPGTSNDINFAITAMSNSLSSGQKGLITLSNGNYTINSQVMMKSNISLRGESRTGVQCNITLTSGGAFLFDNVSYAGIYDMTIQGSWGNPVYNWNYGISANDELEGNDCTSVWLINGANNCWLDRVNIFNSALHTVWCRGLQNTFRDLDVQGGMRKTGGTYGEGYFYIEGSDNLVTGCYITHLRHITIQKHKDSTWDVDYNVFYDNDFDQELSFHTRDDGNNLVENNRITLPYDMPPVAPGDADAVTPVDARTNKPIYFAIMGPWSSNTNHLVSANPNYILNNQCQQDNYNYGTSTPWSEPGKVYSGPIQKGLNDQQKAENFPLVNGSCQNPSGSTLYPVRLNITPPSCETYGTDVIESCNPITWIDGNTYFTSNNTAIYTLTNAVGCDSIVTLNLLIKNGLETTESLTPNADAFVRGGSFANTNYGNSSELLAKFVGNDKYHRKSYLKFDLSAYNASDLVSATLELSVVNNTVDNTSQNLFHVQDDSWTESGITWNNQPVSASSISSFAAPVTGQSVSIDITTAAILALNENNVLSLKIEGTNNQYIRYASREQGTGPKLILIIGGGCNDEPCPDGDDDGICDADDNTNGNCTLNSACDDGDSCTVGDVYDANCYCIGMAVGDVDNDGICNAIDNTNGNCTLGAVCDDENACTAGDVYDANCNCLGTPVGDADNDGICDSIDNTNGNCVLNAACNDGNSCTTGEVYDANCNCIGGVSEDSNTLDLLTPTDDTFIRGGSYAGNNYGNSTTLQVKKGGNDKYTRNSYFRFNVAQVDVNQLQSATFRIKVFSNNSSNVAQELLQAPNDNWTEANLTWNNNQFGGTSISNFIAPTAGQWLEIDITNTVQSEATGDGLLSLTIISDNTNYIRYHSKESSGNEPELVLNYVGCNNRIAQNVGGVFNIYPNPAYDFVSIDLTDILKQTKNNKKISMKIYSTDGRLIIQKVVPNNVTLRMDVKDLPSNQYYLMSIEIEELKLLSDKFLKL